MKKALNILKYIGFLTVGVVMFYFVYRGLGVENILSEMKNIKWGWIWFSFLFSILSHLSRSIRWNMLISPLGHKPRTINTFASVMIMYATNLAIPRGGELARCTVLSRYEKIPFGKLVGTVVTERATDTLILMLLAFTTIISQIGVFRQFITNNPEFGDKIAFLLNPWIWIIAIVMGISALVLVWKFRNKLKQVKLFAKIYDLLFNFLQGIKSIKDLKHPGRFIAHSIFIYAMYFLMLYVVFYSYAPTEHLGLIVGLTTFIMGGLAMLAPVQGGIGAWHFMVIETLAIYGIAKTDGQIFALVCHTTMNLFLIVIGVLFIILLPFINRKKATDIS